MPVQPGFCEQPCLFLNLCYLHLHSPSRTGLLLNLNMRATPQIPAPFSFNLHPTQSIAPVTCSLLGDFSTLVQLPQPQGPRGSSHPSPLGLVPHSDQSVGLGWGEGGAVGGWRLRGGAAEEGRPCLGQAAPSPAGALSRGAESSRASSLPRAHSPFPHIIAFQPRTSLQWEFPFLLLLKYTVINKLMLLTATTRKLQ